MDFRHDCESDCVRSGSGALCVISCEFRPSKTRPSSCSCKLDLALATSGSYGRTNLSSGLQFLFASAVAADDDDDDDDGSVMMITIMITFINKSTDFCGPYLSIALELDSPKREAPSSSSPLG